MELTPLFHVYLCGVFICLQLWQFFLGHPALALSFVLWFVGTFPLLQIHRSRVSLLLFKLLLDLDNISVCPAKRGDVQGLHLIMDVPV